MSPREEGSAAAGAGELLNGLSAEPSGPPLGLSLGLSLGEDGAASGSRAVSIVDR